MTHQKAFKADLLACTESHAEGKEACSEQHGTDLAGLEVSFCLHMMSIWRAAEVSLSAEAGLVPAGFGKWRLCWHASAQPWEVDGTFQLMWSPQAVRFSPALLCLGTGEATSAVQRWLAASDFPCSLTLDMVADSNLSCGAGL